MSEKYCIDKILEKPGKITPERRFERHEVRPSGQESRALEDASDSKRHFEEGYMLHVPREYQRPVAYRPVESVCRVKGTRCYCQEPPRHALPAWVGDAPCSHYENAYEYRTYIRQPYYTTDDREHTAFGNSSLATRIKQQQSVSSTGGSRKRKRHRTAFTPTQLLGLENAFEQSHYSVGEERKQLASFLGLSETQIKVWFQNRRTKWKRIRKEAEEMSLTDDEADSDHKYEIHIPRCEPYCQRSEGVHLSHEQEHRCDKRWPPVHHAWNQDRGRF